MDIHRCRFVHYPPSTINALAFSQSKVTDDTKCAPPRLAVGRANGDIEIWNPLSGSWLQETIIRGGKDRSIDGLVWTQDPIEEIQGETLIGKARLFSCGYTTTVLEWDLEKGKPKRHASGNHGEIWCLAAQPPVVGTPKEGEWPGQHLIAGCTDGALVLYSTKDDNLQLQKILIRPSSKKAKIISVTFKDRNIVVAGCSDSMIRIFDIRNGAMLRSMSLGAGPAGGPKEIIVWTVKTLKDGTIVSGDSTGELRIWSGETYTLKQRIKGHRQDVLSLATSADGSTIITGGMDRRTVVYKQVGRGKSRWAEVTHRRYHKHDVKSMASFESKDMSVVVSGGPDAAPNVLPLSKFGFENQRALPFLPQESIIQSSSKRRLMMSWWDGEVHIWRLGKFPKSAATSEDEEDDPTQTRKLVAKILIKGESNITSASLNRDGTLLAVATTDDIKMFQLKNRKAEDGLRVSKIDVPSNISIGARSIEFSPNGKWLCVVRQDSRIITARVAQEDSSFALYPHASKLKRLDRDTPKMALLGGLGRYDRTVTRIAFSADSKVLVVSDLAGYIDSFVLSGEEDLAAELPELDVPDSSSDSSDSDSSSEEEEETSSASRNLIYGQQWIRNPSASSIPRLPSAATVLSFRPDSNLQNGHSNSLSPHPTRNNPHPISRSLPTSATTPDRLFIMTACYSIFEFNVLSGSLTPWSRRNPSSVLPEDFRRNRDHAIGCFWDVTSKHSRIWLYGVGWLWMFDLNVDFPISAENGAGALSNGNKSNGVTAQTQNKKRKLKGGKDISTGAGNAIPDDQLGLGISRKMQKVNEEGSKVIKQDMNLDPSPFDEMDLDTDDEGPTALERLRRGSSSGEARISGAKTSWHTYKYRPILGVVVVGEGTGDAGPEVAIVERPIWEVELPPRYYGDQEWERGDL